MSISTLSSVNAHCRVSTKGATKGPLYAPVPQPVPLTRPAVLPAVRPTFPTGIRYVSRRYKLAHMIWRRAHTSRFFRVRAHELPVAPIIEAWVHANPTARPHEIAREVGCHRYLVYLTRRRLGLPRVPSGMPATPPEMQQRAYESRAAGKAWAEIAADLGWRSEVQPCREARRWATANGLAWPPKGAVDHRRGADQGKAAYEARLRGVPWERIGRGLGHAPGSARRSAYAVAQHYAKGAGLPFPPEVKRAKRPMTPASLGEQCYVLRAEGLDWTAIKLQTGCGGKAFNAAQNFARSRRLPWPPTLIAASRLGFARRER